eukprot:6413984-Pyramimonas_sp.AAC.1
MGRAGKEVHPRTTCSMRRFSISRWRRRSASRNLSGNCAARRAGGLGVRGGRRSERRRMRRPSGTSSLHIVCCSPAACFINGVQPDALDVRNWEQPGFCRDLVELFSSTQIVGTHEESF